MSALPGRDGMRSRDRCDVTPPPPRPCPTSHAPHSDADEHWYAGADTTVVSYSACWLSPLPPCTILHTRGPLTSFIIGFFFFFLGDHSVTGLVYWGGGREAEATGKGRGLIQQL